MTLMDIKIETIIYNCTRNAFSNQFIRKIYKRLKYSYLYIRIHLPIVDSE